MLDPETKMLVTEGLKEIRAIADGRMSFEQARFLPDGTRVERTVGQVRVVLPPTGLAAVAAAGGLGVTGFAMFMAFGAILLQVRYLLVEGEVFGTRLYILISIAALLAASGFFLFFARDYRNLKFVILSQIILAVVMGVYAVVGAGDRIAAMFSGIGAVIAIADGFDKLKNRKVQK